MASNPALVDLSTFVGRWRMELSGASFLPDPDARLTGTAEFDWIEGGAAIVMRRRPDDGSSEAIWIFGRDEDVSGYQVHYADDRGVARRYEMSLDGRSWLMWRTTPAFSQQFAAAIDDERRVVTGTWTKSTDGGAIWEHDFDIDYIRLDSSRSTARSS